MVTQIPARILGGFVALALSFAGLTTFGDALAAAPTLDNRTGKFAVKIPEHRAFPLGYTSGYVATWDSEGRLDVGLQEGYGPELVAKYPGLRVVAVAAGYDFSLALTTAGRVLAWGTNGWGPLNVPPEAASGIVSIAAGANHALAVTREGKVIGWGRESCGQLDIPSAAMADVVEVSTSYCHSLALKEDGSVIAWGTPPHPYADNPDFGPLEPLPVPEAARFGAASVHASDYGAYVVKRDGSVVAWYPTCDYYYPPPDSLLYEPTARCEYVVQIPSSAPGAKQAGSGYIPVEASTGVVEIASSGIHRIAYKSDGSVYQWGHVGFRYGSGSRNIVRVRGAMDGPFVGQPCTFALNEAGQLLRACHRRSPVAMATPRIALNRTIDFDARYRHVVAIIGVADDLPKGLEVVDSLRDAGRGRQVFCQIYLRSNDPLLGPKKPPLPGLRPVHNLRPDHWIEFRPAGNASAPWQATYPAAYLTDGGPDMITPDVILRFRCGTAKAKGKVPEFLVRIVNSLGPGPAQTTVGPPPMWSEDGLYRP